MGKQSLTLKLVVCHVPDLALERLSVTRHGMLKLVTYTCDLVSFSATLRPCALPWRCKDLLGFPSTLFHFRFKPIYTMSSRRESDFARLERLLREANERTEEEQKRAQEADERAVKERKRAQEADEQAVEERKRAQKADKRAEEERKRAQEADQRADEEQKRANKEQTKTRHTTFEEYF
jgi:hypothetical protein